MSERTIKDLQMMQALPLSVKVKMTQQRIRDWVNEYGLDGVYISFSGGKDSTVLLTIAREMYPDIKAVFSDTGLEYPEIREFVKTWDNVDWVRPKMNFRQVIEKYGYPFISKEVSECVWGARKYLTSVIESQSALNERTNERTNEWHGMDRSIVSYADVASTQNLKGGVRTTSTADSVESGTTRRTFAESNRQERVYSSQLGNQQTHGDVRPEIHGMAQNKTVLWKAIQSCKIGGGWKRKGRRKPHRHQNESTTHYRPTTMEWLSTICGFNG